VSFGAYDRAFALKATPDLNLIKQAKQAGAIQLAGEVKARGERRRVRSD
jgi:peptide subunit release factor RF-3